MTIPWTGKMQPKIVEQIQGHPVKMNSSRYDVFKRSLTCVTCGLVGEVLYIERQPDAAKQGSQFHLNLYGTDPKTGKEVMLTKDHIKPKSKGGNDHLNNLQTMCGPCNVRKGNKQ